MAGEGTGNLLSSTRCGDGLLGLGGDLGAGCLCMDGQIRGRSALAHGLNTGRRRLRVDRKAGFTVIVARGVRIDGGRQVGIAG